MNINIQITFIGIQYILYNQQSLNKMQKKFQLSENDQTKITYLLTNFAKSQPNVLKYSQAVALMLDRCILNTKFTLTHFHEVFECAMKVRGKGNQKTQVQGQRTINKDQLIFLLNETAKILYKPAPNYLQRFYNSFLSEKAQTDGGEINGARVMLVDQHSKKLIVQEVIKKISQYSQEIKHIFIAYIHQNYFSLKRKKRLLLNFRQIVLQNKRWSYISLILFLKQSQTVPHLMTIQHIQQILRLIIPNISSKQHQFYSRHVLSDGYHKDLQSIETSQHAGDPGVMLFEFQLLIVRLAFQSFPKDMERKQIGAVVQRYIKYLYLRVNSELNTSPYPSISRKMIGKMKEYYKIISNEDGDEVVKTEVEVEQLTPFQKLARKMDKELVNAPPLSLDIHEILKMLDRQLLKMPPVPVIQQQCPGPYDKENVITIGQQPPPQILQKDQKAKGEKKDTSKKDEQPLREYKWADLPQTKTSAQNYFKDMHSKLEYEVKPLGDISRGTIHKQSYPVLIGQILFPPKLPKSVVPFLQATSNALSDRNFILAIDNLTNGANAWKLTTVQFDSVAQLYFEYSIGNVYLSAGKLQYAFQTFFNCRQFADTSHIPFANPDRSLPYYGMGQVFFQMQEYQLAARSFLKSRQIRQSVLGLEHVQTASVFNNLACCFFMLGRSHQALGYMQIAQVVIDTKLGAHHERTMTCRSNLKKIMRGQFQNKPAYRKFWEVFEEDKFQKGNGGNKKNEASKESNKQ